MTKLEGVTGLVDLIYDAALEPKLWVAVMEQFADLVGGNSGWLSQINVTDGSGGGLDDPVSRVDPVWPRRYFEYFGERNPFATFTGDDGPVEFMRHWSPRVLTHEDQIPRDVTAGTEFFNDFLAPQNIQSCMMIRLAKSGLETATLNINCSPRKDRFSAADIEIAEALQPHLVRAFRLGRRLADERRTTEAMSAWSSGAHAVFALRYAGRVVRMNSAAEAMIRQPASLRVVGGRLTATAPDDARRLDGLITAALSGDTGLRTGGSMAIAVPHGPKPLAVIVAPIRPDPAWPFHVDPGAIVCATDLNAMVAMPEERLRALFGLTAAEARLALAIFDGASPRDAADQFGVSFQTVRNQLSRVFEKTGTRGQSDLVGMLWRIVGN